jgi:hypothetical protein
VQAVQPLQLQPDAQQRHQVQLQQSQLEPALPDLRAGPQALGLREMQFGVLSFSSLNPSVCESPLVWRLFEHFSSKLFQRARQSHVTQHSHRRRHEWLP